MTLKLSTRRDKSLLPLELCRGFSVEGKVPEVFFDGENDTPDRLYKLACHDHMSSVLVLCDADIDVEKWSEGYLRFIHSLTYFSKIYVSDDLSRNARIHLSSAFHRIDFYSKKKGRASYPLNEKDVIPVEGFDAVFIHWGGYWQKDLGHTKPLAIQLNQKRWVIGERQ